MYTYDVALSFAGEHRPFVKKVKEYLESKGLNVFYDEDNRAAMLGTNLVDLFQQVFTNNSKFCALFVSKEYVQNKWTNAEREHIEARRLVDNGYLLPIRFDNTPLPGLPDTVSHMSVGDKSPEEIGEIIYQRVTGRLIQTISAPAITFRKPKLAQAFNPHKVRDEFVGFILAQVQDRCERSELECYVGDNAGNPYIRVFHNGKTKYSLNIMKSGGFSHSDKGIYFYGASEKAYPYNSSNAFGSFMWSKEKEYVVLELHNMSLFEGFGSDKKNYTKEEFLEKLWEKIVESVEDD